MAKLVRRHTSNVAILSSTLSASIYFFAFKLTTFNEDGISLNFFFKGQPASHCRTPDLFRQYSIPIYI